ncbi:hypothetical protein [Actinacidiphila acididurans]|uniref:Uncharacterized protein n=1 Tax=Actinacidiphila acididurans TaxID=2784346 RepID=A0ABS2TTK1_9ACTN|nr:hypothetical protein [Actinacidiphila acididurans]MBM9506669.1 hypothetical protein [Actinacidiphila acididurans]
MTRSRTTSAKDWEPADAQTVYAHGTRTHIRLDPNTLRPAPWSDEARVLATKFAGPLS